MREKKTEKSLKTQFYIYLQMKSSLIENPVVQTVIGMHTGGLQTHNSAAMQHTPQHKKRTIHNLLRQNSVNSTEII